MEKVKDNSKVVFSFDNGSSIEGDIIKENESENEVKGLNTKYYYG